VKKDRPIMEPSKNLKQKSHDKQNQDYNVQRQQLKTSKHLKE
jgi:hypothetical protein